MAQELDGGNGGQFGASVTISGESRTVVVEREGFPTLTVTDDGADTLTAEWGGVDDLDPKRTVSEEESRAGITSLSPPACSSADGVAAFRELALRALTAAVEATVLLDGDAMQVLRQRALITVNAALRAIDFDV